jgi:predicted RNA-binding protein
MCQVAVFLDDEKIMDSVMLVEPIPEGVRLVKMFEAPRTVSASIQLIDLSISRINLKSNQEKEDNG